MLFDLQWGYYVIATIHLDKYETYCPNREFGWSEDAEDEMAAWWAQKYGAGRVAEDWLDWQNPEPMRIEGNPAHIWLGDGRATVFCVAGIP
jgi:hypothetical protein